MKKRFLIIAALICLLVSCRNPAEGSPDDPDNPVNPNQETVIVFDNTQGICTAIVYNDGQRRDEDKIAEIPVGASSPEIEWTPGTSVVFYFTYRISLKGISGFTLNYVPTTIGKDRTVVPVNANAKTNIVIPKLAETLSSPDTLLSNNSYLLIQNNSSYSFQLLRGDGILQPDNLSNSLVISGERAQYTVNPGGASPYRLLTMDGGYIPFPGSLVSFEAGCVYVFIFSNGALSLASEVEIKLDNVAGVSPNKPVPQAPAAPSVIASDGLLTVRWVAVESAESYEVYRSTGQNPPALPERTVYSTTTVLTGLTNKTAYYVWVKAANENGSSDFSPRARGIPWPANEAPAAPGRPSIIPGINQLTVNWEEAGGASSYEVYVSTTPTTPSAAAVTTDKTSAVINNLQNDVVYYIWVRAVNSAGRSGYSPAEAGTPQIPTAAPAAPPRPALSAGNRELAVSWQAVALAATYEVWFGTSDDSAQAQQFDGDISGGITETVITGLTNETTYYVWIKAKNVVGASGFSLPANAKPSAFAVPPETPDTPTVISGNRELSVSWQAVEGTLFYEVWTGITNNAANAEKHGADVSGMSATLIGLSNGTTYYIWLKAKNNIGTSDFSPRASGTPSASAATPPAPQNAPVVTAGSGQVAVSWQAVEGAAFYEVWMGTTTDPAAAAKRGDDVAGMSSVITGLTNGTTYYVWIKAKNSVGTSGFSPMASGMPQEINISGLTPTTPVASVGNGQISITWAALEGATAYEVWFGTENNSVAAAKSGGDVTASLSATISGLINGTTYYVWIKAKNSVSTSAFSLMASGKPLGTPGAPTLTPGYKQILVTWTAVPGADQYEVYYGTVTPATLAETTSGTTATITGLTNGTTYYVRLRAKNSNGISDYGTTANNIPGLTPGLYRGAEKIGDQNLGSSLSYISDYAVTGDNFYIVLGSDESISPMALDYSNKTVDITLLGYGGERTITLDSNGSMFTVSAGVKLTLDENIKLVGKSANTASLVRVMANSGFTMNGGTISGNSGSGVYNSGTFTMNGGVISGNSNGGVTNSGTFTIHGGVISGNSGNGVYNSGTFTMNGGTISGNTASNNGGGIYLDSVSFTMNGGTISDNVANNVGGGIYATATATSACNITISEGTIRGNTATSGGGIFVDNNYVTVTMNGGAIKGNTATATNTLGGGGGIYLGGGTTESTRGRFSMYGGVISGNTAQNRGGGILTGNYVYVYKAGGSNGGIIYGSEASGNDADGIPLRNRASVSAYGHAVYIRIPSPAQLRNTTAGQTDQIDTTTSRGLSENGIAPFGQ